MANCMTCRYNDKRAKYCTLMGAHTDLGYVLNCIAWAPTDEVEMKRLRTENAKLRDLVLGMMTCSDDSEEAQKCPLYDENEPYRCGKDRLMGELGLSKE